MPHTIFGDLVLRGYSTVSFFIFAWFLVLLGKDTKKLAYYKINLQIIFILKFIQ